MENAKKILKKYLPLILLLSAAAVVLAFGFVKVRVEYKAPLFGKGDGSFSPQLSDGEIMEAEYEVTGAPVSIREFMVSFVTYGVANQGGEVVFSVNSDRKGEIVKTGFPVASIAEWGWMKAPCEKASVMEPSERLTIRLEAQNFTSENALSVVLSHDGVPDVRVRWDRWDAFQKSYLVFSFLLLGLIILFYIGLYLRKLPLWILLGTAMTVMMLMYQVLIPTDLGPDEDTHIGCADEVAEVFSGWKGTSDEGHITVTKEEAKREIFHDGPDHEHYAEYLHTLFSPASYEGLGKWYREGTMENPRITYAPAGLGISIGRLMNLSYAGIHTMGRIFSFAVILLLLLYAMKRITAGREILFLLCMLPMTMQQVTAINADGIDMALVFALMAAVFHTVYGKKDRWRYLDYAVIVITSLLLSRCKFGALLPAVFLLLLVFFRKRKEKGKEEKILAYGSLALTVIAVLAGFIPILTKVNAVCSQTVWSDFYSFSDVLSDIPGMFKVFLNSLYNQGDLYLLSTGGQYLGWNNIVVPQYIILVFLTLLALSCIRKEGEMAFSGKERIFFGILGILGIAMVFGGMLISRTVKGSDQIAGVQGRYFLPFLPLLLLAVRPKRLLAKKEGHYREHLMMASVFMHVFMITALYVRS